MAKRILEYIKIGEREFRVKRSSRRTVAVRAGKDGVGEILSPYGLSEKQLYGIVLPYVEKVEAQCAKITEENKKRAAFQIHYGDFVRCLGEKIEIKSYNKKKPCIDNKALYIKSNLNETEIRTSVIRAYKDFAKEYISGRVAYIANKMGLEPTSVKVNSATTHLGSCSRKNSLTFSWFIIMATVEAIDYVIVHELCHMLYFNHSKDFWNTVEKVCPDYKNQKKYLKELWRDIYEENWF